MGLITRTSFSLGDIPSTSEWNTQFDTAYNEINGSLDSNNLANDAVSTDKIANNAVTSDKINTDAVTTDKILDANVTNAKLATNPVVDWQETTLTADVSSNGVIAQLTTTLTASQTYRISGVFLSNLNNSGTDKSVELTILDGANTVMYFNSSVDGSSGGRIISKSFSTIYTMSGTSLTFSASNMSANGLWLGNGTRDESYIIIEKLPNHNETTVT